MNRNVSVHSSRSDVWLNLPTVAGRVLATFPFGNPRATCLCVGGAFHHPNVKCREETDSHSCKSLYIKKKKKKIPPVNSTLFLARHPASRCGWCWTRAGTDQGYLSSPQTLLTLPVQALAFWLYLALSLWGVVSSCWFLLGFFFYFNFIFFLFIFYFLFLYVCVFISHFFRGKILWF